MIKSINYKIENNNLVVDVECVPRDFATHPIKLLTTRELYDILSKEHDLQAVVSEPSCSVGNTQRRKVRLRGTWVFELKKENTNSAEKNEQKKSNRKTTTKRNTTKTNQANPSKSKPSIRGRISKLNKKN